MKGIVIERSRQLNWRRVGIWTLGMTVATLFLSALGLAFTYPHYDFSFFAYAFDVVWHQHHPMLLYNLPQERAWLTHLGYGEMAQSFGFFDQYVYPPQFAVIFSWLAAFPYGTALTLWEIASVCAYLAAVHWMVRIACPQKHNVLRMLLYVIAAVQLPYLWDFLIGNSNWLIFFLVAFAFHLNYSKGRRWLAGIPLGFAVIFKVTPIVIVLYYVLKREWRLPLIAVCTGALCTVLSAAVVGWNTMWTYLTSIRVLSAQSMRNGPAPYNSSLQGILQGWRLHTNIHVFHQSVDVAFVVYTLIALCMVVAVACRRRLDPRADIAFSTLSMLLLSPLIEGPHMIIALFAMFAVAGAGVRGRLPRGWWGLAVVGIVAVLSPVGWLLRSAFPAEYFVVLWVLFAVTYAQHGGSTKPDAVPASREYPV